METWGWLIAYIAGFGLLQLLLYRYFGRSNPGPESTPGTGDQSGSAVSVPGGTTTARGVVCGHCGVENEADRMFRYCSDCTAPLQ